MKRSELNPLPEYFERYINKCDDVELLQALDTSVMELENLSLEKWNAIGERVYTPGKWTIHDIFQHLIDTERIFSYRALAFARGDEQTLPFFNEDEYAVAARASQRKLNDLVEELRMSHISVIHLFQSFSTDMLLKSGKGFKGKYSVADIGFVLAGHQRWHFEVIEEKYLPLLAV